MSDTQIRGGIAARAHKGSVQITQQDLVSVLNGKLGAKVVAFIAGKDASTITRWKNGAVVAPEEALRPLRVAYQVFTLLEPEDADHTIRAWFLGMNPQLDDVSPTEALAEGKLREVLAAARAFHAGG